MRSGTEVTRRADAAATGAALALIALSVALAGWVYAAGSSDAMSADAPAAEAPASPEPTSRSLPLAGNPDALVLAGRARDLLVGLAATPGGPVDLLALGGQGSIRANGLTARANGSLAPVTSCGNGCFRISVRPMTGTPLVLSLQFQRTGAASVTLTFRLPARLPPDGAATLGRVTRRMRALRSVQYDESLTGGLGSSVRTHYAMQAPDRLSFRTSQGQRTILIGTRRWDLEGGRWVESPIPAVRAPTYAWEGSRNARLIGRTRVAGTSVSVVSAFARSIPAWFRIFVRSDGRVIEAEMLAEGHFMRHRFFGLNEPVEIEAPK